jgi:hypothetical protein
MLRSASPGRRAAASSARRVLSTWFSSRTTCTGSRISLAWCMIARSMLWRIHHEA